MIPAPFPLLLFCACLVVAFGLMAAYSYRNNRHL